MPNWWWPRNKGRFTRQVSHVKPTGFYCTAFYWELARRLEQTNSTIEARVALKRQRRDHFYCYVAVVHSRTQCEIKGRRRILYCCQFFLPKTNTYVLYSKEYRLVAHTYNIEYATLLVCWMEKKEGRPHQLSFVSWCESWAHMDHHCTTNDSKIQLKQQEHRKSIHFTSPR